MDFYNDLFVGAYPDNPGPGSSEADLCIFDSAASALTGKSNLNMTRLYKVISGQIQSEKNIYFHGH